MERRYNSMKRINKGTQGSLTPLRLRCNIALSILSPLTSYEPLLGENRELGEKRDSTLRTNTGLI